MLKILSKITETEEQNELVFDILFEYLNQFFFIYELNKAICLYRDHF